MPNKSMSNKSKSLQIINEEAMTELGAKLASLSYRGLIIYLDGDLGTGKTTLVRGFLRALGHQGAVKSPTFTIVEPYFLDYNKLLNYNTLEDNLKLNTYKEKQRNLNCSDLNEPDLNESTLKQPGLKIYHFDLYRLEDPEELEYIGIRDYLDGQAIALIEWPEKGYGILPEADLMIKITHQKQQRQVELIPQSDRAQVLVAKFC